MGSRDGSESPTFMFYGDDGRGRIEKSKSENKFRTGDSVYLVERGEKRGPFEIASVPSPGRYTLCLTDGTSVKNGQEVDEKDLEGA